MCGICGEIRFDGQSADVAAVTRMTGAMASRGPDSDGARRARPDRVRTPATVDHRPVRAGRQPMVDSDLGLTLVFNGCIYNYQDLRTELEAVGYRFFSTADSEVVIKAFHRWGAGCVERFKGMFAFAIADRDTGVVTLARDRLGIKPLYLAETDGRLRFASTVRALLEAGDVDTELDRVALHHYMSFHSVVPAPRTMYRGVRKLPPATVRVIQPDGVHVDTVYWTPLFERDPARASWTERDWQASAAGLAAHRGGPADGRRRASRRAAVRRHRLVDRGRAARRAGPARPGHLQHRLRLRRRRIRRRVLLLRPDRETFDTDHHRIHIDSSRLLPAVPKTIAAMSEPMVSHDCVAFYLLSEEVSKSVKVVQSGQGADEILAGYDWYPPLANVAREQTTEAYAKVFFDRGHADVLAIFAPEYADRRRRPEPPVRHGAPGRARRRDRGRRRAAARHPGDARRRPGQAGRHHDDGVGPGGPGAVPRPRLRRAGRHLPARAEAGSGGKGVLKDASRALLPAEVIDRTKGYFPVPGIRHLHGDVLDMVRDALTNDAARARGLYRPETVDALLAAPNESRTTLGANALWQLAVLEMWLQSMEG